MKRLIGRLFVVLGVAGLALAGCDAARLGDEEREVVASLSLDALPPLPGDPSNRVADDELAAAFGATLFFDTRMSANGEVACATCHQIDSRFQDGLPRGRGISATDRRTMPLAGVAWNRWFFWDGRRDSLWAQALEPLEDAREHGGNRTAYAHAIAGRYSERYERIFGPLPALDRLPDEASPRGDVAERRAWRAMAAEDREAVDGVFANLGKALAAFQRSIRPSETRFDRFARTLAAGREPEGEAGLSDLEREGVKLFLGKANCIECHNGPRFTDGEFHNTGVPAVDGLPRDPGRAGAVDTVRTDPFNCLGEHSDAHPDECRELRFMVDEGEELVRAYKTPSLRGVAGRAPYMHAGQFATLEEVVDHYSQAPDAPEGESELRGVVFTERGRNALVAFLKSLEPLERPVAEAASGP